MIILLLLSALIIVIPITIIVVALLAVLTQMIGDKEKLSKKVVDSEINK